MTGAYSRNLNSSRTFSVNFFLSLSLYRVPLVDADDERSAFFVRIAGDRRVVADDPFGRIDDQKDDVRHPDMTRAPSRRSASPSSRCVLPLRRMPGGIDEVYSTLSSNHRFVHRVARGARDRRDDGALAVR